MLHTIYYILHNISYIRHRAFRHEKRVRGTPLDFSDLLRSGAVCSLVLETHRVQGLIRTVTRFRTILHFFSEALFLQRSVPKRLPRDRPKHTKISKICKKSGL